MNDASLELQKTIITALRGNAGVTALVSNIYDRAPQTLGSPLITLGPDQVLPFGNAVHDSCEAFQQIDIWSRADDPMKEAKQIRAAVITALDKTTPTVTGFTLNSLRAEQGSILADPDGKTIHGIVAIRAVLSPT